MPDLAVRDAHPLEAAKIHSLLVEAFQDDVLPYTIYRAPQSVSRLAALAGEGRVRVVGDVDGVSIVAGSHLDYIAVSEASRGCGIGKALVGEFHRTSGATTLDVLRENPAFDWYRSLGYQPIRESLSVRLAPKFTGEPPETWEVALKEEQVNGFAAVGHAGMRLGLLAGRALRILDDGGRSSNENLEILASIGFAGRREVILMGLAEMPQGYEPIQIATSVRMRKEK